MNARQAQRIAIAYTVLSGIVFLLMCTYNAWSPGDGFMGTADDPFEQKVITTWFIWGFLFTLAIWVVWFVLWSYEENKKD